MLAAPLSGWLGDRLNKKQLFACGVALCVMAALALHGDWVLFFQMGAMAVVLLIAYIWFQPAAARLPDRSSRKALIIFGAILWSLATLATVWVHDYWTFYIRQAFVGIGEATFGIFAPAILADFYPSVSAIASSPFFYAGNSNWCGPGLSGGRAVGHALGLACAVPCLRHSRTDYCGAVWPLGPRARARRQRQHGADRQHHHLSGAFRNPAYLSATFAWLPSLSPWAASRLGTDIPASFCRAFGRPI